MTLAANLLFIFPVTFVVLGFWLWRSQRWQLPASRQWLLALLLFAAWSTVLFSYALDSEANFLTTFRWRVLSNYLLSGALLAMAWTTGRYLSVPHKRLALPLGAGAILLLAAFLVDPSTLWPNLFDTVRLASQDVKQFDVWGAIWGATLFLPVFAAWIMVQQALRQLPDSVSSNQLRFWRLVLLLALAGCVPGLIRQPGQIFWSLSAAILFLAAGLLGSNVLGNSGLPEIRLVYRRIARLLLTVLPVLALTFLAIWIVVRTELGVQLTANNFGLAVTAALMSVAVVFSSQLFASLLSWLARRRRQPERQLAPLEWHDDMLDLQPLGQAMLTTVQQTLDTEDVWLALTDDGPAGRLLLRPLAHTAAAQLETSALAADSPLARQWRDQAGPLVQGDIFHLLDFREMSGAEQNQVKSWSRSVYIPLHAGQRLVGVLGLAPRANQQPYQGPDLQQMKALALQFGPLLAQARSLATLRQTNQYVFEQNQTLVRQNRRLQEQTTLYEQTLALIRPDIREPVTTLDIKWQQLYPQIPPSVDFRDEDMADPISSLKQQMGNLLLVINRVQKHSQFEFTPVHVEELCGQVLEQLENMAQARRVAINFLKDDHLPAICGDPDRLKEAIYYLIHNAIKFNKIGGAVEVTCDRQANAIRVTVSDTGVGVPSERLPAIWDGLALAPSLQGRPGMGLALARFIVQAHGGHVAAASQYGTGSIFSIFLPTYEPRII
ncbi:MAG: GAF domain-containing sensor histidine kinase [Ardenticatenales bacterium]|nr:GAF domain-containing sensor histidine kinase [Ardenticatenales bacterium]